MKHNILAAVLFFLASLTLAVITPTVLRTSRETEIKGQLMAGHIYDELQSSLSRPIIISEAMAADNLLLHALKNELSTSKKEMEELMSSYLAGIKETFGYIAAFVISTDTRRYYTPNGIAKIIDPECDPYDIWYQAFLNSGKKMSLDTDRDQVNGYRWTVFINSRICDESGRLIGVCGVGLFMDDLQKIIEHEEKAHNLKINFISKDGLVQVDTDSSNIENAYISEAITDRAEEKEFTFRSRSSGGWRMVRLMPEVDWFLVIQKFSRSETINYIPYIIFLYVIFVLFLAVSIHKKTKMNIHSLIKSDATKDPLTGLPNRNYVRDNFGEQGIFNTTRYKSLAMFDIDCFKSINENRNGNEILLGIVAILNQEVENRGLVFRWSGDEFVCFLEMEVQEAENVFKKICNQTFEKLQVTISAGIVEVDLTESIKTNYHRAVQLCYSVKEKGGNGVKRKA